MPTNMIAATTVNNNTILVKAGSIGIIIENRTKTSKGDSTVMHFIVYDKELIFTSEIVWKDA